MADENLGLGVLRGDLKAARARLQTDIERKMAVRDQIDALINSLGDDDSASAGAALPAAGAALRERPAGRAAAQPSRRRTRRPRGLITNKVREYLQRQSEPVHATRILQYLESEGAAPQSEKPMPTLQSTLQRMKETGEVRNTGRNRWVLASKAEPAPTASAPATSEPAGAPEEPAEAATPSAAPAEAETPAPSTGVPPRISSTTSFSSFGGRSPSEA